MAIRPRWRTEGPQRATDQDRSRAGLTPAPAGVPSRCATPVASVVCGSSFPARRKPRWRGNRREACPVRRRRLTNGEDLSVWERQNICAVRNTPSFGEIWPRRQRSDRLRVGLVHYRCIECRLFLHRRDDVAVDVQGERHRAGLYRSASGEATPRCARVHECS